MRILILGGDGMLGHQLFSELSTRHDVRVTLRQDLATYKSYGLFNCENTYPGVDVRKTELLLPVLADFKPHAIINCIGIVKQRPEAEDRILALEINSLLPHRLALLARCVGARLVHISTDCVFSGRKGNYLETDPSDADDLYGRTKFLGEVVESNAVTLRTSIIGPELSGKRGLLEWFMAQHKTVYGFRQAIYSGFTTCEMSRIIERVLLTPSDKFGLYQVSSDPISKFDLLVLIKNFLNLPVEIVPEDEFRCNRSLDSSRFRSDFGYVPPSWEAMVRELATQMEGRSNDSRR